MINSPLGFVDPTGEHAGVLPGIWGAAIAEPTPFGECIAAGITVGIGVYCYCKSDESEHTQNQQEKNREKHEKGKRRKKQDRDKGPNRRPPRKRPDDWKGPWPPNSNLPCYCCFVEGTLILMADGSSKSIEKVQFGDQVLSYDFDREVTLPKTICLRLNPVRNDIIDLRLAGGKIVSSTTDHPYRVQGKGWCSFDPEMTLSHYDIFRNNGISIQKLQVGDKLLIARSPSEQDGPIVVSEIVLESIVERDLKPTSVWILRVGDYGTDWRAAKKLFEAVQASGDFTTYHKEMGLMQSQESSPHSHNFFANGILVHNK